MSPGWWRAKESDAPLPVAYDPGAIQATGVVEDVIPQLLAELSNYLDNAPGAKDGDLLDSLAAGFRGRVEAHLETTPQGRRLRDRWNGVQAPPPAKRRPWNEWKCDAAMEDDE